MSRQEAILALPFLMGLRPSCAFQYWLPLAFYVAFIAEFPIYAMGNAYTSFRFNGFWLPLYLCLFARNDVADGVPNIGTRMVPMLSALLPILMIDGKACRQKPSTRRHVATPESFPMPN